jgi:hypothetical protein
VRLASAPFSLEMRAVCASALWFLVENVIVGLAVAPAVEVGGHLGVFAEAQPRCPVFGGSRTARRLA